MSTDPKADLSNRAKLFAWDAHKHQVRTGTSCPYIVHPLGVAWRVVKHGGTETEIAAAWLHDVIEDCGVSLDSIRSQFGEVADIVNACTQRGSTWLDRRTNFLRSIPTMSPGALLVSVADKCDNLHSIFCGLEDVGEQVWARFSQPKNRVLWYYTSCADAFLREAHREPRIEKLARTLARKVRRLRTAERLVG